MKERAVRIQAAIDRPLVTIERTEELRCTREAQVLGEGLRDLAGLALANVRQVFALLQVDDVLLGAARQSQHRASGHHLDAVAVEIEVAEIRGQRAALREIQFI